MRLLSRKISWNAITVQCAFFARILRTCVPHFSRPLRQACPERSRRVGFLTLAVSCLGILESGPRGIEARSQSLLDYLRFEAAAPQPRSTRLMNKKPTLAAELIAEFIGTFVLILFG